MRRLFLLDFYVVIAIFVSCHGVFAGNVDPDSDGHKYGWGENTGFISFEPSEGSGVTVSDSEVTGYAWSENMGWINLSPASYGGVDHDGSGNLSGYAWAENAGWISFSCENTAICTTADYGVTLDPSTGEFDGQAWSETVGWINFTCSGGEGFCVKTSWRQYLGLTVVPDGTGTGTVISSPSGIDCGSDCSEDYVIGTSVTLTASAGTGSDFSGWSGGDCTGTGDCTVTVDTSKTVTATFTAQQHTLTVATGGTGSGTVTSSPAGIDCGSSCSAVYNYGTSVTLTATPDDGSDFSGWVGTDCSGTGDCTLAIDGDITLAAGFALQDSNGTLSTGGGGGGGCFISTVTTD